MVEASAAIPGRKKLVVVEDEPEIRELEVFLLAAEGYQVFGLKDGEGAKETTKEQRADLVLLDLMLPRKDGFVVLDELEHDPATSRTPVIVVTAFAHSASREALRRRPQVKRIIEKPFDISDLLDAVAAELVPRAER